MKRPRKLPDFRNPPINEVVFGVQYAPIQGYQQIYAKDVWALFENEYPLVEEHEPLPPSLENFGYSSHQINLGFVRGAMHDRFWFLNQNKTELIQFQRDKFIHNWRKVGDETNEYPRFEKIIPKFSKELSALESFYIENFGVNKIEINHCEISYINNIYFEDIEELKLNQIFSFISEEQSFEEFSCGFSNFLRKEDEQPYARFQCKIEQAFSSSKGPLYRMTLSVKGIPNGGKIEDAINFIKHGRIEVVNYFKKLTGSEVHKLWGLKDD